ncbi:hypothetical protein SVIOM74S_04836 [Streptomyces violarus]
MSRVLNGNYPVAASTRERVLKAVDELDYVLNGPAQRSGRRHLQRRADLAWNNTSLIPGDQAVARIRELRETEGGDLAMMGSPTLVRTLLSEGLVEELQLIVSRWWAAARRSFPTTVARARWSWSRRPPPRRAGVRLPAGHRGLLPEVLDV